MATSSRTLRLSRHGLEARLAGFVRSLRKKRPETRGTYQRALREFARWVHDDGRFRFRIEDVERYKEHLSRHKELSEVSVSTYLTALRRFCEYLVHLRVLTANPARHVDGNKRPQAHSRAFLSGDDVARLLASVAREDERGKRDYAIIRLMLDCGLSEIEIIRANIGDIARGGEGTAVSVQGKGRIRKDAVVRIPPEVDEAIAGYLALRSGAGSAEALFTSAGNRTRGRRMSTRGVRDRVNMYLEQAGIKQGRMRRVTPYSLRHTAARLMAERGATAEEIRVRMRLGSIATAQLYLNQQIPSTPGTVEGA